MTPPQLFLNDREGPSRPRSRGHAPNKVVAEGTSPSIIPRRWLCDGIAGKDGRKGWEAEGAPIDLAIYKANDLRISHYRRFTAKDPDLHRIHLQWEHALRKAVLELPEIAFDEETALPA